MASMTSTASTTSVAVMTSTVSFLQTFNLKKNIYFWWFVTFYYLKKAHKSQKYQKFIKKQEISAKIKSNILSRAKWLITIWNETPCNNYLQKSSNNISRYFKDKASCHHYQVTFHNQQIFCHIDSESKEKFRKI
jgi:hypothetical protein